MIVFSNLNPIEVNEGDGQITIEIDPVASGITDIISLQISTNDGSAVSTAFDDDGVGVDFNGINSSTVQVNPDDPDTLAFTININDDAIAEPNENFQFQVTATEDVSLNGSTNVIITDNDGIEEPDLVVEGLFPRISITDVEQLEGNSGNTNFEFTVSLSEASEDLVAVDYTTANGSAEFENVLDNAVLVDSADYISLRDTLEFSPGETEKNITVEVLTDTLSLSEEAPEETFFINLTNATNADLKDLTATGTILDDDLDTTVENTGLPMIRLENSTFVEENTTEQFTVNLTDADGAAFIATEDITFAYSTSDITAVANLDYQFIDNQSATIAQGQSSTTIPVTLLGDDIVEADETFSVVLSALDTNLVQFGSAEAEITIEDNDTIDDETDTETGGDIDSNDIRGNDVFRFFDSVAGVHFYTASETERDFVEDNLNNYELEDSTHASVNPNNLDSAAEIYRFLNPVTGGHFYTANESERDFIINNLDNLVFEDVAFFALETNIANSIPVYRFYEPDLGVHFYTGNETERAFIEDNLSNYNFEGIAYYALPAATESA